MATACMPAKKGSFQLHWAQVSTSTGVRNFYNFIAKKALTRAKHEY